MFRGTFSETLINRVCKLGNFNIIGQHFFLFYFSFQEPFQANMARIKDMVRLLFCSCVCRVSWCCFYFLFMSSNGSIVEFVAPERNEICCLASSLFRGENLSI